MFRLPLGGFLAFMKAPTRGLPVEVGWWMIAISFMILAMSGVLAAVIWGSISFGLGLVLLLRWFNITLFLRSRPGFLTGFLASKTGLYSSGITVGVPL